MVVVHNHTEGELFTLGIALALDAQDSIAHIEQRAVVELGL